MRLLKEGDRIRDTYEVERFLGEGAFAEVYRVKHRFLGRQAMKLFKSPGLTQEDLEGWLEEAVLLSRLGHPNIIRVYDANTHPTGDGDYGFFTMEYVAGGSLDRYWQSHGRQFVPVETAVEILKQACRGLSVGHNESPPIVHRDVKPQNILVGYDTEGIRVRISDFGLAKRVNPLTLLASTKGTLAFKAPEAIQDLQKDSVAADVWGLGATLYVLLTDRLPYTRQGTSDLSDPHRFESPLVPASQLNYQVNRGLDAILQRALAINPKRRYATAGQLLHDLEGWEPTRAVRAADKGSPISLDESKSALGDHPPASESAAAAKAEKALALAQQFSTLSEAADLMEEAIIEWPPLREKYEYQLSLWRRGIVM